MNSLSALISFSNSNKQGVYAELHAAAAAELAGSLKFASREEYLAWVGRWKLTYRRLSLEIRISKIDERHARLPEKVEALAKQRAAALAALAALAEPNFEGISVSLPAVWSVVPRQTQTARALLALRKAGKLAVATVPRV